jgi:hypothetical protein
MYDFKAGHKQLDLITDIEANALNNLIAANRTLADRVAVVSDFDLFKEQIEGPSDLIDSGLGFRLGEIP